MTQLMGRNWWCRIGFSGKTELPARGAAHRCELLRIRLGSLLTQNKASSTLTYTNRYKNEGGSELCLCERRPSALEQF